MKRRLASELQKPGVRYLLIGGSIYLLELLIIFAAGRMGAGPVLSVGLSFWIGLVVSFVLQKVVTFKDKRTETHILAPQIAAYAALVIFNFSFTIVVTALLRHSLSPAITRTLALGITTIWNFYLYKTRIFSRQAE
ncbi:MAG: conserved rane protein [Candidatus Saccharibacteria bacterium]|nr:conserved rane protein [Candidatus Saccharibacteria bacterium]